MEFNVKSAVSVGRLQSMVGFQCFRPAIVTMLLVCLFAVCGAGSAQEPDKRKPDGSPTPEAVAAESLPEQLTTPKVVHVVGVPGVKRNVRGNLILTGSELIFQQGRKQPLRVAYERIDRIRVLAGGREYAGEAIGAAMATPFGLGGWLMALKQKVDLLIIEHHNEAGGSMGVVLQLPKDKGAACLGFLARFGIKVDQPTANSQPPVKQ